MTEQKENPTYYAVIPANVRYDKRLKANEKLLYGEITALCSKEGKCWASNSYFAELYSVSTVSISQWIKNLIECGYLEREIVYREGTKEILKRYIRILNDPIKENLNTYIRNLNDPIKENFKDNNINTNNIKDNIIKENIDILSSKEESHIEDIKTIVDYLMKRQIANIDIIQKKQKD